MDQFERDVMALEREADAGRMTNKEFHRELRLLNESYRAAAEEEAQRAYDDVMASHY